MTRRPSTRTSRPTKSPVSELIDILADAKAESVHEYQTTTHVTSIVEEKLKHHRLRTDQDWDHMIDIFSSEVLGGLSELRGGRDQRRKARWDRAQDVRLEALAWCVRNKVDATSASTAIDDAIAVLRRVHERYFFRDWDSLWRSERVNETSAIDRIPQKRPNDSKEDLDKDVANVARATYQLKMLIALSGESVVDLVNETSDDSAPGQNRVAGRDPSLEARDAWLYEQCCGVTHYKEIMRKLNDKIKGQPKGRAWSGFTSVQGLIKAAKKYAERHGLDSIPPRRGY